MAFDFDKTYVKENQIPHGNAMSRLEFSNEKLKTYENAEDKILHWVKTDIFHLKSTQNRNKGRQRTK